MASAILANNYFNHVKHEDYDEKLQELVDRMPHYSSIKEIEESGVPLNYAGDIDDIQLQLLAVKGLETEFINYYEFIQKKRKNSSELERMKRKLSCFNAIIHKNTPLSLRDEFAPTILRSISVDQLREMKGIRGKGFARIVMKWQKKYDIK